MKTIYNVKALCMVALLGTAAIANAQEDGKKKNLNRELTLEREYAPSVQDASKVNTLPVVKQPEARKIPIDYSNFTIAADPKKEISLLPSGNVMTQMEYTKSRGYLNFGAGTHLNINGDLGYHILSTEKDNLNVWYSHRSTNGNVKYIQEEQEKVKAKINDNLGGLNFKHVFDKMVLVMGAKYGYSGYNYYGLPIMDVSMGPDRKTNQVAQTIAANVGFESHEGAKIGYLLDLGYINFSRKYGLSEDMKGPKEHTFEAKFDVNAHFNGNMNAGLGGVVEYFNYNLPNEECEFINHAEIMLSPYYKVVGDNWNVKLGANVMFSTGENSEFMASPNIAADVEVAEKTQLYLNAGGKMYSNSMYSTSLVNRYVLPIEEIAASRNWVDSKIGIKSGIANGFWFDIFAGYKMTSNDVLFVLSGEGEPGGFGNFSEPLTGVDTKQFFAGAELKYSYQQLFDITLKGVYNNWKGTYNLDDWIGMTEEDADLDHVYGKPEMEINAGLNIRPFKNLALQLDYYLATGRYAKVGNLEDYKMNNINELNLTGTYTINKTFGVYAKLNNILCQKYEVYYGYPMQGFSAMGGVNINF